MGVGKKDEGEEGDSDGDYGGLCVEGIGNR